MALRQRIVKGTLVDGDGNPIESGTISFKPTKVLGYTSTHVVIDREFTVTTDSNGDFSATFWCDEDSLVAIDYLVTFPVENSGQPEPLHFAVISLAYEDGSDKDIGTLMWESSPPPSEVPTATWQALIDGRIQASDLDALADVNIDAMTLANGDTIQWDSTDSEWKNAAGGGGGGVSIGDAVGSGTAGSVLFVGSGNDLQQDNAGFQYDPATNSLKLTAGASTDTPLVVKAASGQTADVLQITDSAGTVKAAVMSDGCLSFSNFPNNVKSLCFNGGAGDVGIRWSAINGGGGFANMLSSTANDVFACEIVNTGGKMRLHTNGTSKGLGYWNQSVERWGIQGDTNTMFAFKGADVAAAAAITPTGNVFHVTGTTNITSITSTNIKAGTTITIIFDGILTVTDGSNLKLAGNFTTAADATLTVVFDGSNWYEISRSTN